MGSDGPPVFEFSEQIVVTAPGQRRRHLLRHEDYLVLKDGPGYDPGGERAWFMFCLGGLISCALALATVLATCPLEGDGGKIMPSRLVALIAFVAGTAGSLVGALIYGLRQRSHRPRAAYQGVIERIEGDFASPPVVGETYRGRPPQTALPNEAASVATTRRGPATPSSRAAHTSAPRSPSPAASHGGGGFGSGGSGLDDAATKRPAGRPASAAHRLAGETDVEARAIAEVKKAIIRGGGRKSWTIRPVDGRIAVLNQESGQSVVLHPLEILDRGDPGEFLDRVLARL